MGMRDMRVYNTTETMPHVLLKTTLCYEANGGWCGEKDVSRIKKTQARKHTVLSEREERVCVEERP